MMLVPIRLCRKYDCILFKPLFATGFHYGLDERGLGDGRDIDLKFLRALESQHRASQKPYISVRPYNHVPL